MKVIPRTPVYFFCLWISGLFGLTADGIGLAAPPMRIAERGRKQLPTIPSKYINMELAPGYPSIIKTGYSGHYCCESFSGLARELCAAASDQEPEKVKKLVEAGADVNAGSAWPLTKGMTPLMLSVWHKWNVEAAELLIEAGADPNAEDHRGSTALIHATQSRPVITLSVLKLLIEAGADVNHPDQKGITALMHASMHHDPAAVEILLKAGADVHARDKNGWTALMHANRRKSGTAEIVDLLIKAGADVNAAHDRGGTPLSIASFHGHRQAAERLIEAGADVNAKDDAGWTPLIGSSLNGHSKIVKLLISAGAQVNARDRLGRTALSCASSAGHRKTASLLIDAQAQQATRAMKVDSRRTGRASRDY